MLATSPHSCCHCEPLSLFVFCSRVLAGTKIGAEGCRALAEALAQNTALTSIDLNSRLKLVACNTLQLPAGCVVCDASYAMHLVTCISMCGRRQQVWFGGLLRAGGGADDKLIAERDLS
eukprot:6182283-Pleurochrysis_carterae.AAC.5